MNGSIRLGIRSAGAGFLRIVYPPICEGCGRRIDESELPLCSRCIQDLDRPDPGEIDRRLHQLPTGEILDRVYALWFFDPGGTVQHFQHLIKYGNRPRYGLFAGRLIGRVVQECSCGVDYPLIVPVPLHTGRLLERGYNQSTMLARGIQQVTGGSVDETILVRRRATRSQTNLSREERLENVRGAFAVNHPDRIKGANCLIVDDVLTTGSTVLSVAQCLKVAGAGRIAVAVLALVEKF